MISFIQYITEEHEHGDFIRGEDGKPTPFYHGTRQAFDEFRPKFNKKMQHGFGMHFAYDPAKAEHYTDPKQSHSKGKAPNMHKVHLRAKNVLDVDQMYHKDKHPIHYALHQALHKGTGRRALEDQGHFVLHPDITNPERAQKLIQQHGFDAMKYKVRERGHNRDDYPGMVVFHPGQIHTAFHPIKESTDDNDKLIYTHHPSEESSDRKGDHIMAAWHPNHHNDLPSNIKNSRYLNSIKKPDGMQQHNLVGYVVASGNHDGTHTPKQVYVSPSKRRQGIATSMYNKYKSMYGQSYKKSGALTPEGAAFRSKLKEAYRVDHYYHGKNLGHGLSHAAAKELANSASNGADGAGKHHITRESKASTYEHPDWKHVPKSYEKGVCEYYHAPHGHVERTFEYPEWEAFHVHPKYKHGKEFLGKFKGIDGGAKAAIAAVEKAHKITKTK